MARRASQIFLFMALCASTPAVAAGTWDCTFTAHNIATGTTGHATVEVDGDVLTEKTDAWKVSDERFQFPAMTVRFHVLENNEFGLVAAYPQAVRNVERGLFIGATVLTLSKS